jgi:hypothetical protein
VSSNATMCANTLHFVNILLFEQLQNATSILDDEEAKGSHSVFELSKFVDINNMKEAAGTYYYRKIANYGRTQ